MCVCTYMQLHCRHWNFGFHPNLKNSPLTPRFCEAPGLHRDPVAICFLRNGCHGLSNMPQLVLRWCFSKERNTVVK